MPRSLTLDLDDAILDALDRAAERSHRTPADIVSQAVKDYLDLQAWQMQKIEAGLAAADRGDFADEAEIERIAQKYFPTG